MRPPFYEKFNVFSADREGMLQLSINIIIHVMLDEKFNDMAIRQFEAVAPGLNDYWIVDKELRLTKSPLAKKCTLDALLSKISSPNVAGVILHSLPYSHYRLLRHISKDKCVVWLGWGYDYYPLLPHDNKNPLILPKTQSLQPISYKRLIKDILKKFLFKIGFLINRASISDLKRINYFSPVLDIEYEMLVKHVPLKAKYINWNYGTAEDDLSLPGTGASVGQNILAGNSATPTNNHVELFHAIRDQVDLTNRKVIVPLSYGDSDYRAKVMALGEQLLGESFSPLTTFMPKDQYLAIVRSCGFIIMNHLRQQALGNICMALLMGGRVFLNKYSPLSEWLISRGAVIGNIDSLKLVPLTATDQEINRKFIFSHWSRNHQRKKTEELIKAVICFNKNSE